MKCDFCESQALLENPTLCKKHLMESVVERVKSAVSKFELFDDHNKILVALSGGKDSLSLLKILKENFPNELHAILIDEGIPGYRNLTIEAAKKYCEEMNIPLTIKSFFEEFNFKVADIPKRHCSYCGVFRRYLLNSAAKGLADKNTRIVTAHNLDDEVQSILMNLFQNDYARFLRCGPITGTGVSTEYFVPRVKPFRLVTERESAAYFFLSGMKTEDKECPNAKDSYRIAVRDALNDFVYKTDRELKAKILEWYDNLLPKLKSVSKATTLHSCNICKEASSANTCKSCTMLKELETIGVVAK